MGPAILEILSDVAVVLWFFGKRTEANIIYLVCRLLKAKGIDGEDDLDEAVKEAERLKKEAR